MAIIGINRRLKHKESRLLLEGLVPDSEMANFVVSFNEMGLGGNFGSIYAERVREEYLLAMITFPVTRKGFLAQGKAKKILYSCGGVVLR